MQTGLVSIDMEPVSYTDLLNEEEILDVYVESLADQAEADEHQRKAQENPIRAVLLGPTIPSDKEKKRDRDGGKAKVRAGLESNTEERRRAKERFVQWMKVK